MTRSGIGALLLPIIACLPCFLVLVAAAGGAALAGGVAAWIADNALIAVAGVVAALLVALAFLAYRRRCAAACEVDSGVAQESRFIGSRR